ncbi:MAG: p-aminobenzoyl-glutamate transporter [Chloroflexi bacterium]|nr:MAG: p-aminobenzoyl-glutamate transporter [Chloroflexota bacterium]
MSAASAEAASTSSKGVLGFIEKAGNKVPHPVMMFVYLIIFVIILSAVLDLLDVGVTEEVIVPAPIVVEEQWVGGSTRPVEGIVPDYAEREYEIIEQRVNVRSLLTVSGIRHIFTSFVSNFASFSVVAVILVAMIGVGVAEEAGLMAALIRKLVAVAPARALTFIIVFVGGISSVATDAGYLILIPLGAAAFLSVGRHPIAGIAAAYAGVSVFFAVNILIAPVDAMIVEMTNEAIAIVNPGETISITSNLYFSIVSTFLMTFVVTFVTERMVEPRLGKYNPEVALAGGDDGATAPAIDPTAGVDAAVEAKGLRYALYGIIGMIAFYTLLTAPPGAPLRDPETDKIIGNTPFMDSLIFMITMLFLVAGICYGIGAKTIKSSTEVIAAVTKTFASLSGLIFMLLVISQFIAFFNYSNIPTVIAGGMANLLESADINEILLLVALIFVIMLIDFIIPGVMPKWAIFAPVFVPLFIRLGVAPQTVLSAYRIGDSPVNVITPLMVYLPFIVIVAQRYQKSAGIGTVVAMMMPYTLIVAISWTLIFVLWYILGIPLGPGYPVDI